MDSRFGRAPNFLIYDTLQESFQVVDNLKGVEAAHGAGIQAAETMARLGIEAIVTGHCGPKAEQALRAAGIRILSTAAPTVRAALEEFRTGSPSQTESAH